MAKVKNKTFEEVREAYSEYLNADDVAKIDEAYQLAEKLHHDQKRKTGEPYIIHPIQVAAILTDLKMDAETIMVGFLHDVIEDTDETGEDLKERFGADVANLVEGVSKLRHIKYHSNKEELAENHRKLLLAMARDVRVIIVKLADRLHNMRTLDVMRPEKQQRIASETLEIYAPLAHRLGLATIKWELEDLSLRYLNNAEYHKIVKLMAAKREERLEDVERAVQEIEAAVKSLKIKDYEVSGRPKHIYSVYRKMMDKHKQFGEIYDLIAIRVLVDSIPDTYAVLGAIHAKWKPVPGRFKDYIALPKPNGYQSLHTTIIGPSGRPIEVQIRTHEMHRVAEFGIAAHWAYKENHGSDEKVQADNDQTQLNIIKGILELQDETNNADEFIDAVTGDLFSDRVFAFTPKGDVFELTAGSVPLDMAYLIHTEVGNKTTGAKVNGKIVSLDYEIKTGDIVEIITSSSAQPSRDWLNIVKSRRARNKIRQYFRDLDRDENILVGKDMLARSIADQGFEPTELLSVENLDDAREALHFESIDDMLASIGYGDLSLQQATTKMTRKIRDANQEAEAKSFEEAILSDDTHNNQQEKAAQKVTTSDQNHHKTQQNDVVIEGVDNLLIRLGRCCTPVPGDEITGYITKGRGVSIHRVGCPNIKAAQASGERLVDASWSDLSGDRPDYNADLIIGGNNRDGMLSDVVRTVNGHTHYLNAIDGRVDHNGMVMINLTVGVRNVGQLKKVIDSVNNIPDVYDVKRVFH